MTSNCFALIVCYHPDSEILSSLITSLSTQVRKILLLNNGGIKDDLAGRIAHIDNYLVVDFNGNAGLPRALNAGVQMAVDDAAEWVVTFDQDSRPPDDHVARLVEAWHAKASTGVKVGAVGPVFIDDRDPTIRYPFYKADGLIVQRVTRPASDGCAETEVLITSGMLIATGVWLDNLRYCDPLFVDFVDTEWCLRATSRGYHLFGCFDVVMRHRPSDRKPIRLPGILLFGYSPLRRYYYFRNTLWVLKMPHVSLPFKIRIFIGSGIRVFTSPFVDRNFVGSVKGIFKGLMHGFRYSANTFPSP